MSEYFDTIQFAKQKLTMKYMNNYLYNFIIFNILMVFINFI